MTKSMAEQLGKGLFGLTVEGVWSTVTGMAKGKSEAAGHTASSAEEQRATSVYPQLFILAIPVKRLTYGMVPASVSMDFSAPVSMGPPAPVRVGPPAPLSLTKKPAHRERGLEAWFHGDSKSYEVDTNHHACPIWDFREQLETSQLLPENDEHASTADL